MTDKELEAERLKLQKWGTYIGLASIIISALTLYLNTRRK